MGAQPFRGTSKDWRNRSIGTSTKKRSDKSCPRGEITPRHASVQAGVNHLESSCVEKHLGFWWARSWQKASNIDKIDKKLSLRAKQAISTVGRITVASRLKQVVVLLCSPPDAQLEGQVQCWTRWYKRDTDLLEQVQWRTTKMLKGLEQTLLISMQW